jgi:hypothetical protein
LWDELENHPINYSQENPSICENNGYSWEYRGSFKQDNILLSEFLHRSHPKTNQLYRVVLSRILENDDNLGKLNKII